MDNIIMYREMFDYLPDYIRDPILKLDYHLYNEIRLRVNKPVFASVNGKYIEIKTDKLLTYQDMDAIILRLTKHSVYAYNENIKCGYLCCDDGDRIGLCGTCVYENGEIRTLKDISSICIRIHKEIFGCSNFLLNSCFFDGLSNILFISPPGAGKTTLLRDSARLISNKFNKNILLIDEKNELSGNGRFNVGKSTDILKFSKKEFAFNVGILNIRPDVIITDELVSKSDVNGAVSAILSGVNVLASAHAKNIKDLEKKEILRELLDDGLFNYVIELSGETFPGQVVNILKL